MNNENEFLLALLNGTTTQSKADSPSALAAVLLTKLDKIKLPYVYKNVLEQGLFSSYVLAVCCCVFIVVV